METLTPLKYFGQREALMDHVLQIIPQKKFHRFYDLFSGSGSISFTAMQENIAEKYFLNDSLSCLSILWQTIKNNPQEAKHHYRNYYKKLHNVDKTYDENYFALVDEFNHPTDIKQNAYLFAFLINHSLNNMPLFNTDKKFIAQPLKHQSKEAQKNVEWFDERVDCLHHLFSGKEISFNSGDFYSHLDSAEESDFVIFDPPYPKQSEEIYFNLKSASELKQQLEKAIIKLNEKKVPFILFYGVNDLEQEHQFLSEELQLVHLLHQSEHELFGKFVEHVYCSQNLNLPEKLVNFSFY